MVVLVGIGGIGGKLFGSTAEYRDDAPLLQPLASAQAMMSGWSRTLPWARRTSSASRWASSLSYNAAPTPRLRKSGCTTQTAKPTPGSVVVGFKAATP